MLDYAKKYRELRHQLGLSQAKFAIKSGTSRSIISQIEIGKLKPSLENIATVVKTFSLSYSYFFDENVNLNVNPIVNLIPKKDRLNERDVLNESQEAGYGKRGILLVPVKAQAGYLAGYGDPEYIEQLEYFSIPGCTNASYRMFEIEGESMHPTFSPGDFVVGRQETDCYNILEGTIYIIVSRSEGIIIKRVLNGNKTPGKLLLGSDNPSFKPIELDCTTVAEMWEFYMLLTTLPGQQDPAVARLRNLEHEVVDIKRFLKKK
jgi:transcriptional regulator with XRE-family HTH domain